MYSGDLSSHTFWVLVYDPEGLFYPQASNACAGPFVEVRHDDNTWSTTVRLGDETAAGCYDIILTVAPIGSPADQAFTEWLTIGCRTGTYQGFDVLPEGLMELHTVAVEVQP